MSKSSPVSEVLAVIPARSGSKAIRDKNVRSFRGKPLLAHSVLQALEAETVDRVIVSTDSAEYAEVARRYGAETPFVRPSEIAGDLSTDLEVFRHALVWLDENEDYRPEICVHLRPTYPTREVSDIDGAVRLLLRRNDAESVRSVVNSPLTPYKMWKKGADGFVLPILRDHEQGWNLPRQALPPVYIQNAAVDVVRTDVIMNKNSMTGSLVLGYEMQGFDDIDDWSDVDRVNNSVLTKNDSPTNKRFVFDLDGVLAQIVENNEYEKSCPDIEMINFSNRLFELGNYIIIYTARGAITGIDWRSVTENQLNKWDVRYHELRFDKPAADFYIDDRNVSVGCARSWCAMVK